ncbi:hypothetical protein CBM2629_B80015 [Cupriavidus taiwanensis]|nr:hypothetical protein CBM2629_B80015 [Cupriavidus taiwanensis]
MANKPSSLEPHARAPCASQRRRTDRAGAEGRPGRAAHRQAHQILRFCGSLTQRTHLIFVLGSYRIRSRP